MLDVVVLPWVPETAIVGFRRVISPSRSARCISGARRSGLLSGIALEYTTSAPSGTLAASWPTRGSIPAPFSVAAYGEPAARSDPVTLAPSA
jgi:hypothetical protein